MDGKLSELADLHHSANTVCLISHTKRAEVLMATQKVTDKTFTRFIQSQKIPETKAFGLKGDLLVTQLRDVIL
ncbi:hypothetical protein [Alicyclobacillus ferrooxydans]|uniref:Uncharacterized protein n=1 Tax=Alicyclobacillus ferrooxydans TaxID=471514 RepID=A0A0N8PP41_9BACL|nr:hypothetical protein [Alicyclobacillus ferrooxydans]KPV43269.1 hypothetical protein AN477_13600 [Alicyclobacillus ferrooxydans]